MHIDTHPKRKRGEKPPMSRRESALVISMMVGGVLFLAWHPVWIEPPRIAWSFIIYGVIGLAWSPLLFYFSKTRDVIYSTTSSILVLGILCLIVCLCSYTYTFMQGEFPRDNICTSDTQPSGHTQYTCTVLDFLVFSDEYVIMIFDSPQNLPIMWHVVTFHCPQDCQSSSPSEN